MEYKSSLRIAVTTTFDFGKFLKRLESSKEIASVFGKGAAKASKEAIKAGLSPGLEEVTTKIRKIRGSGGNKPLFDTGKLYNSIKETKEGLTFEGYGDYHRREQTPKKKPVLVRLSGEQREKVFFVKNVGGKVKVPARDFVRIGTPPKRELSNIIKKALHK